METILFAFACVGSALDNIADELSFFIRKRVEETWPSADEVARFLIHHDTIAGDMPMDPTCALRR